MPDIAILLDISDSFGSLTKIAEYEESLRMRERLEKVCYFSGFLFDGFHMDEYII